MQDKLAIYLITYNRKQYLQRTFDQIFAENSPIKNFSITILDNASTDGTSELIDEYCQKFPNIIHIRHKVNIGGNANICRAYEMGASSDKEYVWVLCDDDKYDFSNWNNLVDLINKGDADIICIANYFYKNKSDYSNLVYQIPQLSFVPAGIYKTNLITDTVLTNMYDSIYTMFQQACITINAINNNKTIRVLDCPIVYNGFHFDDACKDLEYTRGAEKKDVLKRRNDTNWVLGFSNILSLLNNKKLIAECMDVAIPYKDIYASFYNFYYCLYKEYFNFQKFNYFLEIYNALKFKRKIQFLLFFIVYIISMIIHFYKIGDAIFVKLFNLLKIKIWDKKWVIKNKEK